jgi:hypothetical protein
MDRLKILLAFALGCLLNSPIGRIAMPAHAQGSSQGGDVHVCANKNGVLRMVAPAAPCPSGQRSLMIKNAISDPGQDKPRNTTPEGTSLDKAMLEDANRRLIQLEELGCGALGKRKVIAPFEVVDRSGKKIFAVIENAAGLFDGGSTPVAEMIADRAGGLFRATGPDTRVSFGINAPRIAGLTVSEKGKPRIELGKGLEKGTYRLGFLSTSNQLIAGIGENPDNKAGLVLINDGQGKQKAIMEVVDNGRGRVGVMSGSGKPIAALTEGERGAGAFYICAAGSSCDPLMVDAGTNDQGVGVVATGPRFYIQGPTGAPGSFLIGKK